MNPAPPPIAHVCFPRRRRGAATLQAAMEHELSRDVAEAATELLQVLCCGEESAVFAFEKLSRNGALNAAASACAAAIAGEEAFHDELLRGLRAVLPPPRPDTGLVDRLREFYRSLGTPDAFVHLAQISALDAGVCLVLSALRGEGRPIGANPTLDGIFGRIQRDEVGHVRASGRLARELGPARAARDHQARAREGLAGVLLQRADALETLGVDPNRLARRLRRPAPGWH